MRRYSDEEGKIKQGKQNIMMNISILIKDPPIISLSPSYKHFVVFPSHYFQDSQLLLKMSDFLLHFQQFRVDVHGSLGRRGRTAGQQAILLREGDVR